MEKLGVAVIGAGLVGGEHARIFTELRDSELVAVCDVKADQARKVALEYGARSWYTDYEAMLEDTEIEFQAVSVCTPDFAHCGPVVASLEAGKDVLVEKPMATSFADANKMVETAKRTNRKLMVKYLARWRPDHAWMKRAIEDGEIGIPLWGRAYHSDTIYVPTEYLAWAAESSPVWFLTCYDLDVVNWFIDSQVVEVYARGTRTVLHDMGIDTWDGIQAILSYDSGFTLFAESSWIRPNSWPKPVDLHLEIVGSEGVVWEDQRNTTPKLYGRKGARHAFVHGIHELAGQLHGPVRLAIEHFVECVINNREPWTPGSEALRHVEALEAIHRSAESGEIVRLPLKF